MAEDNVDHIYLPEPKFPDHCMSGNILLRVYIEWFRKNDLHLNINGIII